MVEKDRPALTPADLAMLGIMDSFRNFYYRVCMYSDMAHGVAYRANPKRNFQDFNVEWVLKKGWRKDARCVENIRNLIEKVINNYIYLFTDEISEIRVSEGSLKNFSIYEIPNLSNDYNKYRGQPMFIPFYRFLDLIVDVTVLAIREQTKLAAASEDYHRIFAEVREHIRETVESNVQNRVTRYDSHRKPEQDFIRVYSKLDCTRCNKDKHHMAARDWTAELADGSGEIRLPVQRCMDCRKFIAQKETIWLYERRYGKLSVQTEAVEEHGYFSMYEAYPQRTASPLDKIDKKICEANSSEVHDDLIRLLRTCSITYQEMRDSIEYYISRKDWDITLTAASEAWCKNLDFIQQWVVDNNYPQ